MTKICPFSFAECLEEKCAMYTIIHRASSAEFVHVGYCGLRKTLSDYEINHLMGAK